MSKISVYILAYNQADKIKPAIESVRWADEIILIDSYSDDGTTEIAESMGARVIQVEFNGYGDLRNQAIAACSYEWIFSLDSDERCTPEARDEILEIINSDNSADVYHVPRKNFFMGEWINYSGYYPDYRQPQLFRKGRLEYKLDRVHEGFILHTSKPLSYLKNPIWQIPFKNLEEMLYKMDRYSSLGAVKLKEKAKKSLISKAFWHGLWAFLQTFFIKRGFLDGWRGFIIAFYNCESSFYKYAKLYHKNSDWKEPSSSLVTKA
ncbi:(heptosyl)LPS beta-1,4-glucosyltransferase [Candidatus Magnetomoraceae bacterium gMMP-15]